MCRRITCKSSEKSAFLNVTRFENALTGASRHAGELALRAAATF